nr:unnamed protein product [Leishmania braziliensis]
MSIRAVGWLQSKLGLDIGGRGPGGEELVGFSTTQNLSCSKDPVAAANGDLEPGLSGGGNGGGGVGALSSLASEWESKLGQMWKQASDKATQYWSHNMVGRAGNDPFGFGPAGSQGGLDGNSATGDTPELDESGLPVTRNWYYYDAQLGRWTVSRDAPDSVQREYYEKLEEVERGQLGQKTVAPPPPPPPTATAGRSPPLLGATGGARGGHSLHYALPDYFGTASATPAMPQQRAQPYTVYGDAPSYQAQSTAPMVSSPSTMMSTPAGPYYLPTPPTTSTTTSATTQAPSHMQSLSAHSQMSSPPQSAQTYLPAMPAISVPTYPAVGSAYPAASASLTPNSDASSLPPPTPVQSSQPHVYSPPAHDGISTSPPAPAQSQHYGPPPLQSKVPEHYLSVSGDNSTGVPSLSSVHASAPAPTPCAGTAPGTYPYSGGRACNNVSDQHSTTAVVSARFPTPPQTTFVQNTAVPQQQPQPPTSNPYAYPAAVTTAVAGQAFAPPPAAPEQPQPPKGVANGYSVHPPATSLGTFQTISGATARPSAIGLPPPPSFKPFSPS